MLDEEGFYYRLCQAMETKSPEEIARRLGLRERSVYLWKKGAMPGAGGLRIIGRIAELTDTSIHWLMTGEGPRRRPKQRTQTKKETQVQA